MSAGGYFRRISRKLTTDIDTLDAEEMASEARASGACHAAQCHRGEEVTMLGRLRSVESCSQNAGKCMEAEFFDGTDAITLIWIGRRRIPGIEPGRSVKIHGRVGERAGHKVIYNPHYELLVSH